MKLASSAALSSILLILSTGLGACAKGGADPANCPALSGTAWTPGVSGASSANHDASIAISQSVMTGSGPVIGLTQAAPALVEIPITLDMMQDLGPGGSVTLNAQVSGLPSSLHGSAFAALVSLSDGTHEYVNLARSGTNGDCAASGYYVAKPGTQTAIPNPGCTVQAPSAYFDRVHWEEHQLTTDSADHSVSVNTFPTCNWSEGSVTNPLFPDCAFNSTFFPAAPSPARLRFGVNYTAKYVLISDSLSTVPAGVTGSLRVTAVRKSNPASQPTGAVDLNVFLVGTHNVQASRTPKGQQNLNTMISNIARYYAAAPALLKIGNVHAVEWDCSTGGDVFANVPASRQGEMFAAATAVTPANTEGKALNVFLVSSIQADQGDNPNMVTLGIDGAIGGPTLNGTTASGMAVSTFDSLDQLNPTCPADAKTCPLPTQEELAFDLSEAVAHEMGHYFGLNHLTEMDASLSDLVYDTPVCSAKDTHGSLSLLTISSCLNRDTTVYPPTQHTCHEACTAYSTSGGVFCPQAVECEFNYMMWWTVKNYHEGTGASDGLLFSPNQAQIIRYSPMVQ